MSFTRSNRETGMWIVGLVIGGVIGGAYNAAMGVLGALVGRRGWHRRRLEDARAPQATRSRSRRACPRSSSPAGRARCDRGGAVAAQADPLAAAARAPDVASAPVDTRSRRRHSRVCRRDAAGRARALAVRAGRSLPLGAQRWQRHRGAAVVDAGTSRR